MEAFYEADEYYLYHDLSDDQAALNTNVADNDFAQDNYYASTFSCKLCFSLFKCLKASFELALFGVLFGLFATFFWWIELNVSTFCRGKWSQIPEKIHRVRLIVDASEAMMIMFWPLLAIIPICSWSMVERSNLLFWCTIAGLLDANDRVFLYIFGQYNRQWKSYVGNVIFAFTFFIVFYKFARYRQQQFGNNDNIIVITAKLSLQIIIGFVLSLLFNYMFLKVYEEADSLIRTVLSCSLIAVFCIPKLILSNVITNVHDIYKPQEGIVFAASFLTNTTMVSRLAQARIESQTYFIIISIVHGIFNIVDKLTLPLREKFLSCLCKRRNENLAEKSLFVEQFFADQALISMITESTSVIFSNAAAYILLYYYKRDESTGQRYDGLILFKDMVKRASIAVSIELIFNAIALKIQTVHCNIPVLCVWKRQWKFILVIHLMQIIFVVVYFSRYLDKMLLADYLNSINHCIGFFERI